MACDLYDEPTPSNNSGMDHDLDGFHNSTKTGSVVAGVTFYLYRTGSISGSIITMKHYESSSLISTTNATGDITFNDLSTDSGSPTSVPFAYSYTLTANTRFVVTGHGSLRAGDLSDATPSFKFTFSANGGTSWTDYATTALTGCITSGGPPPSTTTFLPPPIAVIRI